MNNTTPEVHIYASGRTFIVVPIVEAPDGKTIEVTPVHTIPLTLGRPTTLRLTRAIRSAREFSTSGESLSAEKWDGDGGRWWQHHLMAMTIKWNAAHIELQEAEQEEKMTECLPATTPEGDLAERLVQRLGQKLHGG